jgi:DUF1365 family protein
MTYLNSVKFFNGNIYHKRIGKIEHFFKNRISAVLIDLEKEDENIQEKLPAFFSFEKFNILSWFSKDHGFRIRNSNKRDLYSFIDNLVQSSCKEKNKIHNIKLLTFPRILGLGFNPLSVYFCYNIECVIIHYVFEVRNTFGDIHHYILNNVNEKGNLQETSKQLFVSPFYERKGSYNLYANYTDNQIQTSVKYFVNNILIFSASMNLNEIKFNNKNIFYSLISLKNFPGKIWINIHLQAFFLWLKKVNLYKIPKQEIIKHSFGKEIVRNENIKFVKNRKDK